MHYESQEDFRLHLQGFGLQVYCSCFPHSGRVTNAKLTKLTNNLRALGHSLIFVTRGQSGEELDIQSLLRGGSPPPNRHIFVPTQRNLHSSAMYGR